MSAISDSTHAPPDPQDILQASDSRSTNPNVHPWLSDIARAHLRRYRVLSVICLVLMNLAYFGFLVPSLPRDALYLFAGISIGMMIGLVALYRRGWAEALAFDAFVKSLHHASDREALQRRRLPDIRKGCVYVLQDVDVTGLYKIGKSTTPVERLAHFDTMLPFTVRLVHVISSKDCNALETMLHRRFAEQRQRGEWFRLSDADVRWLTQIEKA